MSTDTQRNTPYASLGPDIVLDALTAAGLQADGRLLQLNSYENRVWQAPLEDGRVVVVKFYRPGRWSDAQILEEHAFTAELAAADLPVLAPLALQADPLDARLRLSTADAFEAWDDEEERGPSPQPTLGHFSDGASDGTSPGNAWRFAVCERRVGRAAELEEPEVLARMGRLLARLHGVGQRRAFQHRRTLNSQTFGHAARARLIEGSFVQPETEGPWIQVSAQALALVDAAFARHEGLRPIRLHGDCHSGNVLWRAEGQYAGPNFVDFDDCCMGPAVQDLWMLLPGERTAVEAALYHLLDGYRDFREFDDRELLLIEPLRTLRMIHHSAWLAERWSDPAFPQAFPWFASPAYWSQQTTELREQIERMT